MAKRLLPLLVVFALLTTACGSSDDGGVASIEGAPTTTAPARHDALANDEIKLMAFSQCMRDNGVPDFPDPIVTEEGAVDFAGGFDQFEDFDQDAMEEAFDACVDHLDGLSIAPGGENFDLTGIQDTLLEFARCMRDNGFDMPDPDFSNFDLGGGVGPFGEIDPTAPGFEKALEACQDIFENLPFGG
jgi:hypothetical protein